MKLRSFFKENSKAALAFSGGVDSAYLLHAGLAAGADIRAYYVKSCFQPAFEQRDALRLARELGIEPEIIALDVLETEEIAANTKERCYYCKKKILRTIKDHAAAAGYTLIIDGTNASDDAGDRPGMRALREEGVRSPLRECGLTKEEIRRRSREAGLFTWKKPAYACLATRIPEGERITEEKLGAIERAEDFLMGRGYSDFRVRLREGGAILQLTAGQRERAQKDFATIEQELGKSFKKVTIDPEERKKSV